MEGIWTAYNKYMISFGYLPFSWDTENGCLFCIKFDADNNDCGIYKIDHEEMFDFDYPVSYTHLIDYRVRGFTRDVSGKKCFMDQEMASIQDFISEEILLRYDAQDVNVYQSNICLLYTSQ